MHGGVRPGVLQLRLVLGLITPVLLSLTCMQGMYVCQTNNVRRWNSMVEMMIHNLWMVVTSGNRNDKGIFSHAVSCTENWDTDHEGDVKKEVQYYSHPVDNRSRHGKIALQRNLHSLLVGYRKRYDGTAFLNHCAICDSQTVDGHRKKVQWVAFRKWSRVISLFHILAYLHREKLDEDAFQKCVMSLTCC